MISREQQPKSPTESLKDWVSEEVKRRWDRRKHEALDLNLDFPRSIISPVLDMVSSQPEAETVIDILFSELHTREEETKLDCYHSHAIPLEITSYICTHDAFILAQNTEKLYQLLCERRNPDLKTTEKVIVRLFGTMVSRTAMEALKAIPGETSVLEEGSRYDDDATCYYGWQIPFQKKAIQLIHNQGIERFEWLCSQTANILANGVYRAKVLYRSTDHHWNWEEGEGYFYHFGSIEAAIKYLKDNGIESTEIGPNR